MTGRFWPPPAARPVIDSDAGTDPRRTVRYRVSSHMRQIEKYITYVYALYLAGFRHRHPDSDLNDAAAHGMALVTVGVPIAGLTFLGAFYIDRSMEIGALRAVNLLVAAGVFFGISKYVDRVVARYHDRITNMVAEIQESSPSGPLLSYFKGVGLLGLQTIVALIAMYFWV